MRPQPNSRQVAGNPETFGLNLPRRHFAVPAAHAIPSGLQFMRSEIITPRLADMIARTGGVRPIPMVSP